MSDLFYKAAVMVTNHKTSDDWEYHHSYSNGPVVIDGLGTVRVLDVVKPDAAQNHYGEYEQGFEGTISLIFEVTTPDGETVFVRKDGTMNSYGREAWDGGLYEVKPVEKVVQVYERA